jgi:hypothetical protein
MAVYQIFQFDDVVLPLYNPEATHDAGPTASSLRESIGGVFDVYGPRRRQPSRLGVQVSGIYASSESDFVLLASHDGTIIVDHQGDFMATATAQGYLRRQVDAIRAKQGVRGTLYRRRWDDGVVQWKSARLLAVRERGSAAQRARYATIDLEFETPMAAWRAATSSASHALISGHAVGLNVTADGNAPISDAIITVTATGAISALAVKGLSGGAGIDLRYTGSIDAGQTLQIDCGAQSVSLNGAPAYSGFSLGSGHTAPGWLPMVEGITPLVVESNGGSGAVTITWYEQWV